MKKSTIIVIAALTALSLVSCNKGNSTRYSRAIVTVKEDSNKNCYLQLTDNTVLIPENLSSNPYGKEQRALINYIDKGETQPNTILAKYYRFANIQNMASILTKNTVPNMGDQNDALYGHNPIYICRSWMTVVEDGYVTLLFRARWGIPGKTHTINLIRDIDSKDPLHFELRHNYCEDIQAHIGVFAYGLVAFNIRDLIGTDLTTPKVITIDYLSEAGERTFEYYYVPGESVDDFSEDDLASSFESAIQ